MKIILNDNGLKRERYSVNKRLSRLFLLLFLMVTALGGCSQLPEKVTVQAPVQEPVKKKIVVKKEKPGKVVIIVSDNLPAFTKIARLLATKLGKRSRVYNLEGDISRSKKILDKIKTFNKKQVVSIGLLASQVASTLKDTPVIFCQVFNYEDLKLVKPLMKGVSINPDHTILFRVWKKLNPGIKHVAVVTGRNKELLIGRAITIAMKYGIKLTHKVVKTDLSLIYAVKHLPADVEGIWLLPDNRVLSIRALKEIMNYSVKHGKEVAVFRAELLKLGGLFSVQGKIEDVVKQTLIRLKKSNVQKEIPGADVQMLKAAKISINSKMAKLMGLNIPLSYQKYIYDK